MRTRTVLLTLLVAGALLLSARLAGDGEAETGVLLRDASLHSEPSTSSSVVGQLARGVTVELIGRNGAWLLASAAGSETTRGWLRLTHVRLSGAGGEPATAASGGFGGGFAALSRSVSGLLSGFGRRDAPTRAATLGIRGLTPDELRTAQFDEAALAAVAAAGVSAEDAARFARAGGLASREAPAIARLRAAVEATP
ncbi:MAG: SH3 domain-containing protein [Gammaproteobacteria bacterium]